MSTDDSYYLAHTARCKLHIAANRPDRNLRFLLGHAFTLDKIMLRIVEIESESSSGSDEDLDDDTKDQDQHVSFRNNAKPSHAAPARKRSPPPPQLDANVGGSDSDSSDDDDDEDRFLYGDEEDEEEGGMSLRRYASASGQPPRPIADEDSGSEGDEDEPKSPPARPSDEELVMITQGAESDELSDLYQHVVGCPCHGHHEDAPTGGKIWEVPQKAGHEGKRIAVMEVAA